VEKDAKTNGEKTAEWLLLDEETDVMNVPGGVLVRSRAWSTRFGTQAISTVFVPMVVAVSMGGGVGILSNVEGYIAQVMNAAIASGRGEWGIDRPTREIFRASKSTLFSYRISGGRQPDRHA
jgi:hypothetical protein